MRSRSPAGALTVVALTLAACSGSEPPVAPVPTAPTTSVPADGVDPVGDGGDGDGGGDTGGGDTGGGAAAASGEYRVSAVVTFGDAEGALDVTIDPDDLATVDPFGRFAACSGLNRSVGVYSLLMSTDDGPIRSLSVLSVERVGASGIHEADVRVETAGGSAIAAVGSITLDDGLRSGSFLAFDRDGVAITGMFECEGAGGGPEALVPGGDDGVLDSVEVVVLLRRGAAERVVDLAIAGDDPTADLLCPGATGAVNDVLVRVDGSLGAVSTFDLVGATDAAMRLRVGGVVFEFDRLDLETDAARTSGTFSADQPVDGVVADGAFSCS